MSTPRLSLVIFVLFVGCLCVTMLLHFSDLADDVVTVSRVAAVKMPNLLSKKALFMLRLVMLSVNLLATGLKLVDSEQRTHAHKPESKLKPRVNIYIHGPMWISFFTVQSWLLQLFFLSGATICSYLDLHPGLAMDLGTALPTALWMAYEVSFAVAILVSSIVKYVLIPTVLANGESVDSFFIPCDLLMHNANVLFMALELLFNDLPFRLAHFPLAALWGLNYVVFSWVWLAISGICWYDFLDPTLPNAIVIHTVLIVVLGAFFAIGSGLATGAAAIESPYLRVAITLTGVASVCKTGFITGIPKPAPKTE